MWVDEERGRDERGEEVAFQWETNGNLKFKIWDRAGRVDMGGVDLEDGAEVTSVGAAWSGKWDSWVVVKVDAGASVSEEADVGESEDVFVSEVNNVGVVVVEREETVLGLVEFGRADGEASVERVDLGGVGAVAVVDSVEGLVKVTAFLVGGRGGGDAVKSGHGKGFGVASDGFLGENDRGTG